MANKEGFARHYEETTHLRIPIEEVFAFADDHNNFSAHMNSNQGMMMGGKFETVIDEGKGQTKGSHIIMKGSVLGINLFLDEVITTHGPPNSKKWQTVGEVKLLVIDHYQSGFELLPKDKGSEFRVYIDYNLPSSYPGRLLGLALGGMYAKWCVHQMISGVQTRFGENK